MTLFTSAIPVWLNITCGDCGHHQDIQLGPQQNLDQAYECRECRSTEKAKVNIDGSANENMKTVEDVRQG